MVHEDEMDKKDAEIERLKAEVARLQCAGEPSTRQSSPTRQYSRCTVKRAYQSWKGTTCESIIIQRGIGYRHLKELPAGISGLMERR